MSLWLTDGTTWVNMLNPSGFMVRGWEPVRPPLRANIRTAVMADGQQVNDYHWDDISDEWLVEMRHHSQDLLIEETQRLDALLVQAIEYNRSPWKHDPVYIKAKAPDETEFRYALVKSFEWYQDSNPYASPNYGVREASMTGRRLVLLHGPWMAHPPGEGRCTEANNLQAYYYPSHHTVWFAPAQEEDGITAHHATSTAGFHAASDNILGHDGGAPSSVGSGIRFRNVQVPQGATVVSAFVRFTASANAAVDDCNLDIYGQMNATPAAFSNYADYAARLRTTSKVDWDAIGAWAAGNSYDSPDIAAIVQEIIRLPAWAAGNDMVIFFEDDGSDFNANRLFYGWLSGTDYPVLYIQSYVEDVERGTPDTCDPIYVANKHVTAQITDMYYYDSTAGMYSANLIGTAPAPILPDPPVAGDILYVGINTALTDAGIFDNIIFDILTPSADTITWAMDYWNGAWTNFAMNVPLDPLENAGVNSVFWIPETDWVTSAVEGVTGYWVRLRVVAVGAAATAPVMARDPYSCITNYVTVEADQVSGVLPALARLGVWNRTPPLTGPARFTRNQPQRLFVGARSVERGENFRSFLNCSESQHPEGVVFTVRAGAGINASLITALSFGTTGRALQYAAAGAEPFGSLSEKAAWTFSAEASRQYQGRYRALLRGYVAYAAGVTGNDVQVRLCLGYPHAATYWRSDPVGVPARTFGGSERYWIDMGVIELWGPRLGRMQSMSQGNNGIIIEAAATAARTLVIYDLFLLPYDEWAADWSAPDFGWEQWISDLRNGQIDSLSSPLETKGYLAYSTEDHVLLPAILVVTGPVTLPARRAVRLHWAFNNFIPIKYPNQMLNSILVTHAARYTGGRGRR